MGAFNVLKATSPITELPIRIQFKYGERWQYEYNLGERIVFPSGVNTQDNRVTLVGGFTEWPIPSEESGNYEIRFEYGFAVSIRPITEDEFDQLEIGQ